MQRSPSPTRSPPAPYPWEMRIPPPPKLTHNAEEKGESRERLSLTLFRRKAALPSFEAKLEANDAAKQAAALAAERAAAAKTKAEAANKVHEAARQRDAEISEAGRLAAENASNAPLLAVEALNQIKQGHLARREEFLKLAKEIDLQRTDSLKRQLGESILARGTTTNALMKEWDRNGDGNLQKIEFKQAIRLSLTLKASNEQIEELFDAFDGDGGGTLTIAELKPAIRELHDFCRSERSREKRYLLQAEQSATQATAVADCIRITQKYENLHQQLTASRSNPPMAVRLGQLVDQKLTKGETIEELVHKWGGDQDSLV